MRVIALTEEEVTTLLTVINAISTETDLEWLAYYGIGSLTGLRLAQIGHKLQEAPRQSRKEVYAEESKVATFQIAVVTKQKVEGEAIILPGWEWIPAFVYREDMGLYGVIEVTTGWRIGNAEPTKEDAIKKALAILEKTGEEKVRAVIAATPRLALLG